LTQSSEKQRFSSEKVLTPGYEAIGMAGLSAGCLHFFGYPITPQNEITEFFASELPKRGGRFVQAESESAVGAMLFGAAATGVRVMTSTSGPGWALMQETLSHISWCDLPCVVVDVQRGGPGQGTTRHAQTDYLSATRGGYGGYKSIVLAPASVQECHDLVQLAFYLADKYRILVIVLTDGLMIQFREQIECKVLDFKPLPPKDWILNGTDKKDGRWNFVISAKGNFMDNYKPMWEALDKKYQLIAENEVRYETIQANDATLLLVAHGYVARCCKAAMEMARSKGLKVGLIRPVTLWPFPHDVIKQKASEGCKFLVVEDNMGQMIEDVRLGAKKEEEVHFLGLQARHRGGEMGMIFPDPIFEEVCKLA
jgi:2-oxoglutarate ferredoxin oxidoreductase subunit alpha